MKKRQTCLESSSTTLMVERSESSREVFLIIIGLRHRVGSSMGATAALSMEPDV